MDTEAVIDEVEALSKRMNGKGQEKSTPTIKI
jgi:hypothetical protein